MSKNSGYIATYTDKEGIKQQGNVYYRSQSKILVESGKVAINLTDENGNHLKHAGRDVVKLVDKDKVKQIGFID